MTSKRIIGLRYDFGDQPPQVMLKAAGAEADALLQAAEQQDLPVVQDASLVDQLYRVPLDAPIGRELFPVMALLLAHVLQIDQHRDPHG
jgi:flagellar biosynthesis protein